MVKQHGLDRKIIIIGVLLFLFSCGLRLWNLNAMGRVWDEHSLLEKGYRIVELIKHKDFNNTFWYKDASDHPVFAFYFFGIASYGDFIRFDTSIPSVFSSALKGAPIFHYDLTYGRLVSVIVSSFAVVLVFFFGVRYFSLFVGIVSAGILAMMPHFLAYSQEVELESFIVLFFSACVFSYLLYLETHKKQYLYLTGILTGITLQIKQSNVLILVFYLLTYIVYKIITKNKKISLSQFIPLGIMTLATSFIVYPMPWFHATEFIELNYNTWVKGNGRIPELIFGHHMGAPFFYYAVALLVTTPVLIILLTLVGMKVSYMNRKHWIFGALLVWFFVPLLMSFFHLRQHMVRYIIEIYVPMAVLSAIGLEYLFRFIAKKQYQKYLYTFLVFGYLLIILLRITPYYLDYFNELVGGPKTVYTYNLFFLGWWGEGLKDGGMYVANHAPNHARIGLAINPNNNVLYRKDTLIYENFDSKKVYDYVIVNTFAVSRIGFNEKVLSKKYKIVHTVYADGAQLVHVYKHI
jgi:hypothetical protein